MNQSKLLQESQQDKDKEAIIKEENGSIYVWGSNNHGQLGLGDTSIGKTFSAPKPLTFNMFIQEVACGEDHAVFLTSRGQIYTMGSNAEGRLGIGNKNIERSSTPTLLESSSGARCIQVACGWGHTLAVMDSGEVFSWGAGESGALGLGTTESAWGPMLVTLEEKAFLGTRKVAAGSTHSAFISELGTIYMCGAGDAGQLGTGKRDKELKPVQMTLISEKAKDVACGVFHTIILTERGKVYATGGNIFGQLGIGNKKSTNIPIRVKELDYQRVTKIACGHHSAALTETGEVYVWGTGVFGEFVSPTKFSPTGQIFKDINLNGFFGAALDQNGHIWTWGSNTNGELGLGHYDPKTKPHIAEAIQDKKIERFACGVSFVIALGEATGRNRRITPLKLRTQAPVHPDSMPLSNRTPQKIETPLAGQETLENKISAATDLKPRVVSRQPMRTSSVGKPRGEGYDSSTRRGMNSRPREVTGFIDLLGRDKVGGEEGTKREQLNDLDLIEKLLKQKEVLEKALTNERTEKKGLEQDLGELKQRLSRLQEGPEGLAGLTESFNRQTKKFDELKNAYGEETRRREKIFKELQHEQQINKDLSIKIDDRDDAISKLQVKADQGAIAQKRVVELENIKQRQTQQIETMEAQIQDDISEINRHKARNLELEKVVSQKNEVIQRVEEERQAEFNEKKDLQREVADLTQKLQELENRLDRTTQSFDREKEARLQLEEELTIVKHKEESAREQIKRLVVELEDTKSMFERRLQDEEENKAKMQEDINILEQEVQDLREENAILNDEKIGLEDELLESQQKNRRLLELFNEEIDKQNQALHRRPANPVKLTDLAQQKPVRPEPRNPGTAEKSEERKSPYRRNLDQSREEKTNVFGKADNSMTTPTGAESGNFMFRSVDKSQYVQQEEPTMKQSQISATPNEENQVFRLEYDSFGSPNKEVKQQQQTPEVPEDRHRKASESPKKRQNTIDLGGDNSRNIGPYEVYGQTEHSQMYTPERDRSTVVKETGSYSGTKRRSASPSKNFSIADYRSRGSEISDGKDFLEDLKEVQEKMEALERNKRELQNRMQDFETRFTVGENKPQ